LKVELHGPSVLLVLGLQRTIASFSRVLYIASGARSPLPVQLWRARRGGKIRQERSDCRVLIFNVHLPASVLVCSIQHSTRKSKYHVLYTHDTRHLECLCVWDEGRVGFYMICRVSKLSAVTLKHWLILRQSKCSAV